MSDDELSEEQERRMAAKLMGSSEKPSSIVVEVRKRRSKVKTEPVRLRFIHHLDGPNGDWLWCEVEQKGDKGWFKLEEYEDQQKANEAADKYERSGDTVERLQREI